MDQLPDPPPINEPPFHPKGKKVSVIKKLLIVLAVVIVFALIVFVITRSEPDPQPASDQAPPASIGLDIDPAPVSEPEPEPDQLDGDDDLQEQDASAPELNLETDQPASRESELTVDQIRQLINETLELAKLDPADLAAIEAALDRGINNRREILAGIEVQPIDNYVPKTDIGRRYKDLIVEPSDLKDRYQQLVDCQLSTTDLEQFVADSGSIATRGLDLTREIAASLDSGQDHPDLLTDIKRLTPVTIVLDLEIYDILPPDELPAVLTRCYGG